MSDKEEKQYDIKLYEYLGDEGDPFGYKMLGYCYQNGLGAEKNLDEAKKWYKPRMIKA